MTTLVYFDIETVPCQLPGIKEEFAAAVTAPATHKKPETIAVWLAENRDSEAEAAYLKTSFDGGMGQVCCISLAVNDEAPVSYVVHELSRDNETRMLEDFYSHLTDIGRAIFIGHNIIGFDLPFLWKRSMVLGIKPPWSLPRNPMLWPSSRARVGRRSALPRWIRRPMPWPRGSTRLGLARGMWWPCTCRGGQRMWYPCWRF